MAFLGEIGSAFLKSAVDLVVDKFSSPEVQLFLQRQLEGRLPSELKKSLESVNSMLLDAERKQTTEEGVKDWLDDVQHVVHEAEDLLDEIFCQARASKLKTGYFNTEPDAIKKNLKDIFERLGRLEKRARTLCLIKSFMGSLPCEAKFEPGFLSSAIVHMVRRLDFLIRRQILNKGIFEKLNEALITIKIMLPEAETKQIINEDVKNWLQQATGAVFEAANLLLDEIFHEAGRAELKSSSQSYLDKIQKFFTSLCTSNENNKDETVVENLVKILEKLEMLAKEGENRHNLLLSDGHSYIDNGVYGRDSDKETIMPLLLSEDANGKSLEAIVVEGIGGIGKTIFAKLVYLDRKVQECFDLKAWVCVKQEFDAVRIVEDILKNICSFRGVTMDANELQRELKKRLTRKKLLLVLDEVWKADDQHAQWNFLVTALESAAKGSKIIITTREMSPTVASVLPSVTPFNLKEISNDDCWALFLEHACCGEESQARSPFDINFRSKVLGRCGGIPLRAKMIGNHLRCKPHMSWEEILSRGDLQPVIILATMKLRYYTFPSNLKQCFVYCSLFPKDHSFKRETIVLLWLANGFLGGDTGKKEVGYGYFQKLVAYSFFQQKSDDTSSFVMNDLVHSWARSLRGDFSVSLDDGDSHNLSKARHLWCGSKRRYEDLKNLVGDGFHSFRTILPLSNESFWGDVNDEKLKAFNHLRVLSLSNINQLPDVFCWPKHLRHLEISGESIKSLPETLCMTFTLQTLILRQCPNLAELPADIVKLTELCHLDITETGLQQTPPQMGKLKKLETLTDFFVGQQNGCRIDELGELRYLLGELRIWNLQNVSHCLYAFGANLMDKDLKKLELRWSGSRDTDDSLTEEGVLQALWPSAKVEDLSIIGYGGKILPRWVGHASFEKMVDLRLSGCKYCVSLPSLGQLKSLKTLLIEDFYNLEYVGDEFYGRPSTQGNPFQSLESLTFERMLQWREWKSKGGAFPSLQVLCIRKCPSLTALPSDLPSLVELEIAKCKLVGPPSGWSHAPISKIILANDFHKVKLEKLSSDSQSLTVDSFHAFDFVRQEIEEWGYACSTLQKIDITRNPLELFPLNLFPRLKQLEISRCAKLKSLCGPEEPRGDSMSTKSVCSSCPTLETLALSNCSNFESLFCPLPSLVNLKIVACGKLQSLPGMDFSASLKPLAGNSSWNSEVCEYPNLKLLSLEHCSNLKTVHCLLPSLENLELYNCGQLEPFIVMGSASSSGWSSPGFGSPSKLKSVVIRGCRKVIASCDEWGTGPMGRFPYLSTLSLDYSDEVESSLRQRKFLPPAFTFLSICDLPNLTSLELRGLTFLYGLELEDCPKLQSLSEGSVPSDLFSLYIRSCPLLEQRCQQDTGEDWPKISHVPNIKIGSDNFDVKGRKL
ncbi:hypothetical protein NC651_037712 [Populus alba x Populus x berolinensis]|nr:hypothetical protein NC651_037712 [Populus alba x Populus x berolinensis]